MTRWALWVRQLRADASPLVVLAVLLAVTSFVAVAGPRWLNRVDDEAVRYEVRTSREVDDVVATYETALGTDSPAANRLLTERDRVLGSFEPVLAGLIDGPLVAASTPAELMLGVGDVARGAAETPIDVTLTALVDPSPPVRYVDGAEPGATTDRAGPFPLLAQYGEPAAVRVVEVALAAVPAAAAGVEVGDVVTIGGSSPMVVQVSGIFEPVDPSAYVWARHGDLLTDSPVYGVNGLVSNAVSALVAPSALDSFAAALQTSPGRPGEAQVELHYPVTVGDLHAGLVPELIRAADRAESSPLLSAGGPIVVGTSLQAPLERYAGQRATAYAVLSIAAAGLLVSALTVLVLAARLVTDRRRAALALARARGASLRQLVGLAATEAVVVAAVGAAFGAAVGMLVVPARSSPLSWWLLGLLVGAAGLVVGATVAVEHRVFSRTARHDLTRARPTPRRLAAEIGVVVLAVTGAVLLRRRGLGAGTTVAGPDPFLAAVPVLVALATAIVVLRLYPLPLQVLSRLAAARRPLVSFLGVARAGREGATSAAPVVVLLVGLSFAVLASVLVRSIEVEQDGVAWQSVGADLRIDGSDFDPERDVPRIAAAAGIGTEQVLGVHVEGTATVRGFQQIADFDLLLLDAQAYVAFIADHPIETGPLDRLVAAPPGDGDTVPAVVSPALLRELLDGQLGEIPFYLPGTTATLQTLGTAPSFHGHSGDGLWAIARTSDADLVVDLPYAPSILFLDAPSADPEAVLDAARERQPFALLTDRAAVYDAVAAAPLVRATSTAFTLALIVAAVFCLLAIALALVVAAAPRSRFLSYLRTLGLSDRQARWLVAWEVGPPAAVAAIIGAAVGLLLPRLLLPAIDLRPFTGGLEDPPLVVDLRSVGLLVVGLALVVAVAVLLSTTLNRRRQLGAVLRVGEDS